MNIKQAMCAVLMITSCAPQELTPWLTIPQGPRLSENDVAKLSGQNCWGVFDRGNNSETARGAVFIRFSSKPVTGDFWRKWGKEAQHAPQKHTPEGYEHLGPTTQVDIAPAGTELTFRVISSDFDWYLQPIGNGIYATRAVRTGGRGATGTLECSVAQAN